MNAFTLNSRFVFSPFLTSPRDLTKGPAPLFLVLCTPLIFEATWTTLAHIIFVDFFKPVRRTNSWSGTKNALMGANVEINRNSCLIR